MKPTTLLLTLLALTLLMGCQSVNERAAAPTPLPTATAVSKPATATPSSESAPANSVIESSPTAEPAEPTPLPTIADTPTPDVPPEAVIELPGALLPTGFSLIQYAPMYRPTALAFDENGRLFATSFDGTIHLFSDSNGDGRADSDVIFYSGLNIPLGITIHEPTGDVYVSSNGRIDILRDNDGDLRADAVEPFVSDLPTGLHQNDNLKFGPDGRLYIGIGSTCDACFEPDIRSATIMRFDIETGEGEIFASGMRNPYDLAFHPETGDLFATDNGRDDLGDNEPAEELNHILQGADYGWPDCWGRRQGANCDGTETAVAFFEAHASANSIDFYTGSQFPADYHHDAFVAILGSWLVERQRGIARVQLTPSGGSYVGEVTWFAQWNGRPLGLVVGADGALYSGDYENNAIYRISYGN